MWPESFYFKLEDPELSELKDKLAGRSSTPIYDRLMEEYARNKKISEEAENFLNLAKIYQVTSFDIELEEFVKLRDSLIASLYNSFANAQEAVYDLFGDKADIFNSGLYNAVVIIEQVFNQTLSGDDT